MKERELLKIKEMDIGKSHKDTRGTSGICKKGDIIK